MLPSIRYWGQKAYPLVPWVTWMDCTSYRADAWLSSMSSSSGGQVPVAPAGLKWRFCSKSWSPSNSTRASSLGTWSQYRPMSSRL